MKEVLMLTSILSASSLFAEHIWNGKNYNKNSNSQAVSAMKALESYTFNGSERVLDIGCGDGKISAEIKSKVPGGSVLGVDLSPRMIEFAKTNFKDREKLSYQLQDAQKLDFKNEFDLVVSFSAMQWMPDQKAVMEGIHNALRSGGQVVFTIPAGYPDCLMKATNELKIDSKWSRFYGEDFDIGQRFPSVEDFKSYLAQAGFTDIQVTRPARFDHFPSVKAFSDFVRQWLPFLKPIPDHEKDAYMNQLMTHYQVHCPARADGGIDFNKYDVSAVATKR